MSDFQKEIKIRRRIESIYNKSRDDFDSLKAFGDYEEAKEDIIFNLAQGIDVADTEQKVAAYQKENYNEILRNEAEKAESKRQKLEDQAPKVAAIVPSSAADPPATDAPTAAPALPEPASLPPAPVLVATDGGEAAAGNSLSDREAMGIVSGWHPDMSRRRALEEAYSAIFAL